jgi:hypothetical protein
MDGVIFNTTDIWQGGVELTVIGFFRSLAMSDADFYLFFTDLFAVLQCSPGKIKIQPSSISSMHR